MGHLLREERLFIDGKLVEAGDGRTFEILNPATEQVIGVVADGGPQDMRSAIAAARRAFDETDWPGDPEFRARCIRQLHAAILNHAEEFKATIRAEVGATQIGLATSQFDGAVTNLPFQADLAERYEWVTDLGIGEGFGRSHRRLHREPVGVAALITPWNAPLQVQLAKIGPALAAGCTVVLKPAPDTPWTGTILGRLAAEETDIPPGVFNVVSTADNAVAQILAEDPQVDLISFTGSTAVGRKLMAVGAETIKRVFLELGGKSPFVVCDDANVDAAATMAAMQVCIQTGQGCSINTRLLVQRPVYEAAVAKVAEFMRTVAVGDPADPATFMGPLINEKQRQRVLGYIAKGVEEGAKLVVGGGIPDGLETGYYVEPTVFVDVDPQSTIAQEEIFGPVLCVIPFDDDDHAVAIANNTIYGLAGTVESGSVERAQAMAKRIRSGVVNVNGGMYYGAEVPFGGYKQSGVGREMGVLGFEEYTEVKVISEGLPAF